MHNGPSGGLRMYLSYGQTCSGGEWQLRKLSRAGSSCAGRFPGRVPLGFTHVTPAGETFLPRNSLIPSAPVIYLIAHLLPGGNGVFTPQSRGFSDVEFGTRCGASASEAGSPNDGDEG